MGFECGGSTPACRPADCTGEAEGYPHHGCRSQVQPDRTARGYMDPVQSLDPYRPYQLNDVLDHQGEPPRQGIYREADEGIRGPEKDRRELRGC